MESRQLAQQRHEREKRKYTKKKADYWDDGIVETRIKKQRSQVIVKVSPDSEPGSSSHINDGHRVDLNKRSAKDSREKIKSRKIQIKGVH